ncbi:MAG: hypothetical protein ACF8XB_19120 [Planctomycetota bacterium JB042]
MSLAADVTVHARTALAEVRGRLEAAADPESRRAVLEHARGAAADEVLDLLDDLGRHDDVLRFARLHPLAERLTQLRHLLHAERESIRHEADALGSSDHLVYCEAHLAGFDTAIAV